MTCRFQGTTICLPLCNLAHDADYYQHYICVPCTMRRELIITSSRWCRHAINCSGQHVWATLVKSGKLVRNWSPSDLAIIIGRMQKYTI